MSPDALLDPARLERPDTLVRQAPFPFMIAHGQLPDEARGDLDGDTPDGRDDRAAGAPDVDGSATPHRG